jgi:hypothetical protein
MRTYKPHLKRMIEVIESNPMKIWTMGEFTQSYNNELPNDLKLSFHQIRVLVPIAIRKSYFLFRNKRRNDDNMTKFVFIKQEKINEKNTKTS